MRHTLAYDPHLWSEAWLQCRERFLEDLFNHGSSEASVHYYKYMLNRFFHTSATGKPKAPQDYDDDDLHVFINAPSEKHCRNQGQPPAPGTIGLRLSVIRSFYKFASHFKITGPDGQRQRLFVGELPGELLRAPKAESRPRGMQPDEVKAFFSAIDRSTVRGKRDFAIFLFWLMSARRCREILDMNYGDIERSVVADGSLRRDAWVYHWRGKNARNVYDVAELPLNVKAAIDDYLLASGRLVTIERDDPLFIATELPHGGGLPIDPYKHLATVTMSYAMAKYAKKAGLDRHFTIHSFRHTSAQQRVALGADILEVNKLLRHKKLDTTLVYLNGLVSQADRRADQLANLVR